MIEFIDCGWVTTCFDSRGWILDMPVEFAVMLCRPITVSY